MERVYYSINEKSARTAHQMMSFSDYKEGSKTAEYMGYVDRAYELADKIAEAKPDQADRVYGMAGRYSKKMAEYINREIHIGCMCPSVMISGAGNFPVKKKEKQNQAWEKNHQFYKEVQGILDKMKSIFYGKDQILSGDQDAIEKLEGTWMEISNKYGMLESGDVAVDPEDVPEGYAEKALEDFIPPVLSYFFPALFFLPTSRNRICDIH